jgi:hypothetical protein
MYKVSLVELNAISNAPELQSLETTTSQLADVTPLPVVSAVIIAEPAATA